MFLKGPLGQQQNWLLITVFSWWAQLKDLPKNGYFQSLGMKCLTCRTVALNRQCHLFRCVFCEYCLHVPDISYQPFALVLGSILREQHHFERGSKRIQIWKHSDWMYGILLLITVYSTTELEEWTEMQWDKPFLSICVIWCTSNSRRSGW